MVAVSEDQVEPGQILTQSEPQTKARVPNLIVASLGAIRKDKPNGTVIARVLVDGTRRTSVKSRTRIRDQERAPIASDIKRAMRETSPNGEETFELTSDGSEAHQQVPIHPRDLHLLGCQVQKGCLCPYRRHVRWRQRPFFLGRVAGDIGPRSRYLIGNRTGTWHLLVTDDVHTGMVGAGYGNSFLTSFTLCASCNVPFLAGADVGKERDKVVWVGLEPLHLTRHLGVPIGAPSGSLRTNTHVHTPCVI